MDIGELTVREYLEGVGRGDMAPHEGVAHYQKRIQKENDSLNAYLEVFDDAEGVARKLEKNPAKKEHPLAGLPLAVKDNILIEGKAATAASKILEGFTAPYSATAILRLEEAGAVFLGRTNMDEFAMGASTENSAFGVTKNPHDKTRVPGGSSGGSAAAVAAGLAPAALGSDTGGSIRQPAGFCGLVGLKPTYGAVSRHGLIAMASSLDQIGPITKTVDDAKLIFDCIKGNDPYDATTLSDKHLGKESKRRVIGYPESFLKQGVDEDVLLNFYESAEAFAKLGYTVKKIDMPALAYALSVYYIIMPAEVSSNLARFDGVKYGSSKEGRDVIDTYFETRREGFGIEARRRILLGTYVLSAGYYDAYYRKASDVRMMLVRSFKETFSDVDLILMPTSPTPAFKIGEKSADPLSMYLSDIFTVSANLTGVPAIAFPSGATERDGKTLPLSIQLMARWGHENDLLSAAGAFESR